MARRTKPLVERSDQGVRINLEDPEQDLLRRLMGELVSLVAEGDPNDPRLRRLFPTAYHDDPEMDAEYQRLMRDEMVHSRRAAAEVVDEAAAGAWLDEGRTVATMQAINAVRLVLGTMLDIAEDDDGDEIDEARAPEMGLYHFLSALLDLLVQALTGTEPESG